MVSSLFIYPLSYRFSVFYKKEEQLVLQCRGTSVENTLALVQHLFVEGLLCVGQVVGLDTNRTVIPTNRILHWMEKSLVQKATVVHCVHYSKYSH